MANIAHVIQHLALGGIESLVLTMMRKQDPRHNVYLITLDTINPDIYNQWPATKNIKARVYSVEKKKGKDWRAVFRLSQLLKRIDIDVVHTHHLGPLIYGGIAAKIARIEQLVHTEHDAWHLESRKARILQRGLFFIAKPILVADAHQVREKLQQIYPSIQSQLIHNGVDTDYFVANDKHRARKYLNLDTNSIWVGCAGRLTKLKGHKYLINALLELEENVHLVFAGEGELQDELKGYAQSLGVLRRIQWLGVCDDMRLFYQALDVFCLPSLKEGLPLALLEAQACNIPAVVTSVGACHEALCKSSGLSVPPYNSKALAKAIMQQINTQQDEQPRQFVLAERSYEQMQTAYDKLYGMRKI